ncbi:hsp70 family protein [bacterium]|jgi:molecular chaperone DnaK (HSP70)|nr:hsp70 family protein [Verrucomicrobiales bacterium]MDC3254882.1 hsp70 family protein [bacterium]MDF1788945.1 Hsp70 family protein [Verrucomicrobiales bacterium]
MTKASLFSIGIDLGTTNSAIAYTRLTDDDSISETFHPAQWESLGSIGQASTLPSFLFLPTDAEASQAGLDEGGARWMVGGFARKQSAETPGRVVHSAKSWLCHHAVDRSADFLPWASGILAESEKISPLYASALILATLKASWDQQFADLGPQGAFSAQQVTITVPASFDAAAQKLTLEAAQMAGFPDNVRLIEEPQAAFYRWLEFQLAGGGFEKALPLGDDGKHVLVVDIGGGTSDFSLFHVSTENDKPKIERTAVSDHILLGGDNVDLALAYMVQARLEGQGHEIGGAQWPFLVARCRDLKERVLATDGADDETFTVSIPGRGSSLLASTLTERLSRQDILAMLLDGFFPLCPADVEPERSDVALKEWGLPYASDSGVTRYLAGFLRERPAIDAVLFNGGTLYPEILRTRLRDLIGTWQDGHTPIDLENTEPDLAVARGAARYGWLTSREQLQIEAGAARALYLEVQQAGGDKAVVCILPRGTDLEEDIKVELEGLKLRVDQPVRFQTYYSTKRGKDKAGSLVKLKKGVFHSLPPLQTVARLDEKKKPESGQIPVRLSARMNALGLLQVSCESMLAGVEATWPLDFNLRAVTVGSTDLSEEGGEAIAGDPGVSEKAMEAGLQLLRRQFRSAGEKLSEKKGKKKNTGKPEKVTPGRVFRSLEEALEMPKQDWNWMLVRSLWPALESSQEGRNRSIEHEETWLSLVGYMLRPGYGAHLDDTRIESLWGILDDGLAYPNKRVKLQEYILWRRLSGGLNREDQEQLLKREWTLIEQSKNPPAELIRMVGSFERLSQERKRSLVALFTGRAVDQLDASKSADAYLVALTLLLNRAPLYAGPEAVVPPEMVEEAYERLAPLDWTDERLREVLPLFLRAARVVDNPYLDVSKPIRKKIANQLEKADVAPMKVVPVRSYAPLEKSDRAGLLGESLPAGIVLE